MLPNGLVIKLLKKSAFVEIQKSEFGLVFERIHDDKINKSIM